MFYNRNEGQQTVLRYFVNVISVLTIILVLDKCYSNGFDFQCSLSLFFILQE